MNWIDITCLIIVTLFTFLGIWAGLFKSIFKLVAWIIAAIGAYYGYDIAGPFISSNFDLTQTTIRMICVIGGFLIPLFSIYTFIFILDRWIKKTPLNGLNRLGGALFGLAKSLIICFVLLTIIHYLPFSGSLHQTRNSSISYELYKELAAKDISTQISMIQTKAAEEVKKLQEQNPEKKESSSSKENSSKSQRK